MNIPYLLKCLDTDQLSELTVNIDLPPLDLDLAIWDAIDDGDISINEKTGKITVLKEAVPSSDEVLTSKILRTIQHYVKNNTNISRGRLNSLIKDPEGGVNNYPWHEYIMAVQKLIDDGIIIEDVIDVPEHKKFYKDKKGRNKEKVDRPAHKFAFLCLPENDNAEWNARVVNNWIASWDDTKVK